MPLCILTYTNPVSSPTSLFCSLYIFIFHRQGRSCSQTNIFLSDLFELAGLPGSCMLWQSHSSAGWITSHCIYVPLSLFIWSIKWKFPYVSSSKYGCAELRRCAFTRRWWIHFIWVQVQKSVCWIIYALYSSLETSVLLLWLSKSVVSPVMFKSYLELLPTFVADF